MVAVHTVCFYFVSSTYSDKLTSPVLQSILDLLCTQLRKLMDRACGPARDMVATGTAQPVSSETEPKTKDEKLEQEEKKITAIESGESVLLTCAL